MMEMWKTEKVKKTRQMRRQKRRMTRVVTKKENEKKRKRVVDSDRAKKKHRMAAMSEKSLKQISDGKPLYDEHISFAEKLLKQQFPTLDGLQSPLLSQNNGFSPVQDESIQIHHTGMFHWVTSTSIGGNVQLFDSMFKGDGLSSSLQIQLIAYDKCEECMVSLWLCRTKVTT